LALQDAATAKSNSDLVEKHSVTFNEESMVALDAAISTAVAGGKYTVSIDFQTKEEGGVVSILHSDSSSITLEHFLLALDEKGYRASIKSKPYNESTIQVSWS